ncbi:hypothetical protein ACB092_07G023900 [Castanea dentata]
MSSGTVHFPAILVTVTCNPRRCVRTPLSGRERKDLSEQPPVRGRVKGSPLLRISPRILDRSSRVRRAPWDHLPLVFGQRDPLCGRNSGAVGSYLKWYTYHSRIECCVANLFIAFMKR